MFFACAQVAERVRRVAEWIWTLHPCGGEEFLHRTGGGPDLVWMGRQPSNGGVFKKNGEAMVKLNFLGRDWKGV